MRVRGGWHQAEDTSHKEGGRESRQLKRGQKQAAALRHTSIACNECRRLRTCAACCAAAVDCPPDPAATAELPPRSLPGLPLLLAGGCRAAALLRRSAAT